jgi:hypothetical protein
MLCWVNRNEAAAASANSVRIDPQTLTHPLIPAKAGALDMICNTLNP